MRDRKAFFERGPNNTLDPVMTAAALNLLNRPLIKHLAQPRRWHSSAMSFGPVAYALS